MSKLCLEADFVIGTFSNKDRKEKKCVSTHINNCWAFLQNSNSVFHSFGLSSSVVNHTIKQEDSRMIIYVADHFDEEANILNENVRKLNHKLYQKMISTLIDHNFLYIYKEKDGTSYFSEELTDKTVVGIGLDLVKIKFNPILCYIAFTYIRLLTDYFLPSDSSGYNYNDFIKEATNIKSKNIKWQSIKCLQIALLTSYDSLDSFIEALEEGFRKETIKREKYKFGEFNEMIFNPTIENYEFFGLVLYNLFDINYFKNKIATFDRIMMDDKHYPKSYEGVNDWFMKENTKAISDSSPEDIYGNKVTWLNILRAARDKNYLKIKKLLDK